MGEHIPKLSPTSQISTDDQAAERAIQERSSICKIEHA